MQKPSSKARLIVAFDMETVKEALVAWSGISSDVEWVKLGDHLLSDPEVTTLIDAIKAHDGRILADLKRIRTSKAVQQSVTHMEHLGVDAVSIYFSRETMAFAKAYAHNSKTLTPLLLTSMSREEVEKNINTKIEELIVDRATYAVDEQRFTGIITSGRELRVIREKLGDNFVAIVPGIRDTELRTRDSDDQKRTVSLEDAFLNGADYVIVGRPILSSDDPKTIVREIQNRIRALFED